MKIGDEITVKGIVIDFDANPYYGSAAKIEVRGSLEKFVEDAATMPFETVRFWIHGVDELCVIER